MRGGLGALRRAGRRAEQALRALASAAARPVVHPWMHREGGQVRDLVRQLDGHLRRFDELAARTQALAARRLATHPAGATPAEATLGEETPTEATLGETTSAEATLGEATPTDPTMPSLAALAATRAALATARDAFDGLATALDEHGPPLREQLAELPAAVSDPRRLRHLRAAIRGHTDALSAADVTCRRGLESAIRTIPDGPTLISALLPNPMAEFAGPSGLPGLSGRTEGASGLAGPSGRIEGAGQAGASVGTAADVIAAGNVTDTAGSQLPPPDADARQLRSGLALLPTVVVRAYVRRHPQVLERLVASAADLDLLPRGLPPEALYGRPHHSSPAQPPAQPPGQLPDPEPHLPPDPPSDPPSDPAPHPPPDPLSDPAPDPPHDGNADPACARIARRKALFAAAPDAALRAALLWPGLIGGLDGASPAARIEANRLLLRAELGRARRADVDLELRAIARRVADSTSVLQRLRGRLLTAWLTRDAITSFVTTNADLPGLERADLRVRILLYQGLLYDRIRDPLDGHAPDGRRRLLLFDPAGRGRLAELWGRLDDQTRAVAVFVPGTGTAVRGFHLPTQVARDLAHALAPTPAAAIAWMGADFPLAIGTNAPLAHYALAAAAPLRDFVLGLPVPTGATLTVLGHSYGGTMVGAADHLGLPADRIVQIASPGAGPGVRGVADYPPRDPLGRPRAPERYSLTAPGDPIRFAQRFEAPWRVVPAVIAAPLRARLAGLSLGVDPERLSGIHVLPAGVWQVARDGHVAGSPVAGPAAHAAVVEPGTQAFARLAQVVGAPP
ncbi:hypothetical protein KILIM_025_00500 [Kineosphaera limosa NBRC 100340]|uniref:DUF1023 domain-containing protein n=2 Tax=Kineosphaera TaxID=211469 RepID=K6VHN0_9MICO|nr:hypothetical protein KILIM_025_00500 [Kineosphaera limosa NBRC 100340]